MENLKFDPFFLENCEINLPQINSKNEFLINRKILNYTHFSILYSLERKMPICTAVNIDGSNQIEIVRSNDNWIFEENINADKQIGPSFYKMTKKEFHRGHIVRRMDPCWGDKLIAEKAEEETFRYVNACPQHRNFNPKIWLELEKSVLEKGAVAHNKKLTVFSGPVLHNDDLPYYEKINDENIFIPFMFWKIVVWKKNNEKVYAIGFVQSQKELIYPHLNTSYKNEKIKSEFDKYIETLSFKNNVVYQTDILNIEKITGLSFSLPNVIKPDIGVSWKEIKANYESKSSVPYKSENLDQFTLDGIIYE